jgi:hypothetical protein
MAPVHRDLVGAGPQPGCRSLQPTSTLPWNRTPVVTRPRWTSSHATTLIATVILCSHVRGLAADRPALPSNIVLMCGQRNAPKRRGSGTRGAATDVRPPRSARRPHIQGRLLCGRLPVGSLLRGSRRHGRRRPHEE